MLFSSEFIDHHALEKFSTESRSIQLEYSRMRPHDLPSTRARIARWKAMSLRFVSHVMQWQSRVHCLSLG